MANNSAISFLKSRPSSTAGRVNVDPAGGNGLHMLLSVDHEGEQIQGMTCTLGAMTG